MLNIIVCVSGGGTNLQAIIDACEKGNIKDTKIVAVISNNPNAFALERAKKHGIEGVCVSPKNYPSREVFHKELLEKMQSYNPDLVVLAGFMVNLPEEIIVAFREKIINIHPSLIPSFCGKGHYGLHVHEAALARGVKVTGATVHYVDEGIDTGRIIMQRPVMVMEGDTAKSLQERVMKEAEWEILPLAISEIASRKKDI